MSNKEELASKDFAELLEIMRSLDIDPTTISSPDEAIEVILKKQDEPAKRKRTRILKKDTTDHVYSVKGNDGENLDTKAAKRKAAESANIFSGAVSVTKEEKVENPFPKHRGRKSKKELEYIAQLEAQANAATEAVAAEPEKPKRKRKTKAEKEAEAAALAAQQAAEAAEAEQSAEVSAEVAQEELPVAETEQAPVETEPELPFAQDEAPIVPEESFNESQQQDDNEPTNLIAALQEKMREHNEANGEKVPEYGEEPISDGVWEGDPGDGTDFIIVHDIPVEDANATVTLDIFDNPVARPIIDNAKGGQAPEPEYDFSGLIKAIGLMEVMSEGYGFLRSSDYNYLSSPDDIFLTVNQIRRYSLKTGDVVECTVCPPATGEKYFTLSEIIHINGRDPMEIRDRVPFEHLTPLFPEEKFELCGNPRTTNLSTRIVDLFSPIGKGQRALIVAQPKTGKTILMKDIANAIAASHPEAYLMMLLIDERPEEVTDMARTVNAEVIASTFDEPADHHVKIAGLVLEKAKRMVECGHDVVIFLDSITRLARAYNTVAPASGKVLTGGVDANALQKPKRFFGAARNIEGGGSLTIIATALIDTGSKMDEVIFEEFKGTGNMELQLERALANKRMFPAVNLIASSTRRDDLLQDKTTLDRMWITRKYISSMNPVEAMTTIMDHIRGTRNNEEFLMSINS